MRKIFDKIKYWFKYRFNKKHKKLIKTAAIGYPFDFAYLYYLEKAKLEEMLDYFSSGKWIGQEDYDRMCFKIKIAINLLDIIINDDIAPDVYVNNSNFSRFMNEQQRFLLNKYPKCLRVEKAKYLYYKLRYYYTETWWD